MEIFIKTVQLLLSLSILVILHEFGHFFFARLFKTRVEKFYLFFNPWFTLFKYKKGETEYGIGWLPLGGYVKISGMIDESMDKEAMAQPPQPWEFRSKPAWQRLMIMVGGVLVNFITAFFIYWMVLYTWGEEYIPVQSAKHGLYYHEVAKEIGLQDGDVVLKVDEHEVEESSDIARFILLENASQLTVKRGEQTLMLAIPEGYDQRMISEEVRTFAQVRFPVVVEDLMKGSSADEAGLLAGDSIVSINGMSTAYFNEFTKALTDNVEKEIELGFVRQDSLMSLNLVVPKSGKIGFFLVTADNYVDIQSHEYGFWEACPKGIAKGVDILVGYVKQLRLIFTKEGAKQVGGFGAMGKLFPSTWNWYVFWSNTALISMILAFMNILPIPALDGGHVLFLMYEIVTGRKPGDKFMEYAQITGMILLLGLLLFANGNDIFKAFFK
ncbi:RIP metalloprotease RseP [Carboxylicivirga mesophila]|uniref:Zinc metalloprotease n=1 Tax=Carboxylicivirga mesophila TaxID=1166478 RepID=A0ABS5K606_9BACT|nr:RIP metalloprotease RseP [Carboxylicivirga mesophila]MBS2210386.1 RIP metalloprotease RseP [Carboxylicivirga mesophila]